jgi:hypothetical protein
LLDAAVELFSGGQRRKVENQDALIAELYEQIGRLQMETAWLKKRGNRSQGTVSCERLRSSRSTDE